MVSWTTTTSTTSEHFVLFTLITHFYLIFNKNLFKSGYSSASFSSSRIRIISVEPKNFATSNKSTSFTSCIIMGCCCGYVLIFLHYFIIHLTHSIFYRWVWCCYICWKLHCKYYAISFITTKKIFSLYGCI